MFNLLKNKVVIHSKYEGEGCVNRDYCMWKQTLKQGEKLSAREVKRPANLQNRIGESDHCVLFWLDYFKRDEMNILTERKRRIDIHVLTRDTDFLPVILSFFSHLDQFDFNVFINYPSLPKEEKDLDNGDVLVSIRHIYNRVKLQSSNLNHPEWNLVVAISISGTDYLDDFPGMTQNKKRFLEPFISLFLTRYRNNSRDDSCCFMGQ